MVPHKKSTTTFALALMLVGLALMLAPPAGDRAAAQENPHPQTPDLSALASQTPFCYKPRLRTDTCLVSWYQLSVSTTDPARMSSLTITIDGKLRANFQGFFQNSFYIPYSLFKPGFQVACGYLGASGVAGMGKRYTYVVYAIDSTNASVTNSGNVVCPANDLLRNYLPLLRKR